MCDKLGLCTRVFNHVLKSYSLFQWVLNGRLCSFPFCSPSPFPFSLFPFPFHAAPLPFLLSVHMSWVQVSLLTRCCSQRALLASWSKQAELKHVPKHWSLVWRAALPWRPCSERPVDLGMFPKQFPCTLLLAQQLLSDEGLLMLTDPINGIFLVQT